MRLTDVTHSTPATTTRPYLRTGETWCIKVGFQANTATEDVVFSVEIRDDESRC